MGFTDLESRLYCELLRDGPGTGYRLARTVGKAAANVYQGLNGLALKGAVLADEGEPQTFRAVPPDELLAALGQAFEARRAAADQALSTLPAGVADDRIYHLKTVDQVMEKAAAMIRGARSILLFDLFAEPLRILKPELDRAAGRGLIIAGLTYGVEVEAPYPVVTSPMSDFAMRRWPGLQVTLVADARQYLTALLSHAMDAVRHGVWSDSAYLACMQHSGLQAEIRFSAGPAAQGALDHISLLRAYPPGLQDVVGPMVKDDRRNLA